MSKDEKKKISRKGFLGITSVISVFGLFGQAGIALFQFMKPRKEDGAFGGKVLAGRVEEFLPGQVSHVQKGRFYISTNEDGGLLALWHRCTHLGCTIPWIAGEEKFHCPCHSSIFTSYGEIISGPAPRPLDIFPIEIIEGEVIVDTGNPIERKEHDPTHLTYS